MLVFLRSHAQTKCFWSVNFKAEHFVSLARLHWLRVSNVDIHSNSFGELLHCFSPGRTNACTYLLGQLTTQKIPKVNLILKCFLLELQYMEEGFYFLCMDDSKQAPSLESLPHCSWQQTRAVPLQPSAILTGRKVEVESSLCWLLQLS